MTTISRASRPSARPLATLLLALALVLTTHTAAGAAPSQQRDAEAVDLAGAAWTVPDDHGTTHVTLTVTDGSATADGPGRERWSGALTLMYDRYLTDPATGDTVHVAYESLTGLPTGAFRFDPSLREAAATFDVALRNGTRCRYPGGGEPTPGLVGGAADDPQEPQDDCVRLPDVALTMTLDWTGVGPVHRGTVRHRETTFPHGRLLFHQLTVARDARVTAAVVTHGTPPDGFAWPSVDPDAGVLLRGRMHQRQLILR